MLTREQGDGEQVRACPAEACQTGRHIAVVIPVFNDWESLTILLPALDLTLGTCGLAGEVVVVDDGSTEAITEPLQTKTYRNLPSIRFVRLRCNLGHQRAIAVGLAHVYKTMVGLRAIIVMDGDGEDKPDDIPLMIEEMERWGGDCVVFAARTRRFEPWTFQLMYHLYRFFHRLMTGVPVRVGNFSALAPGVVGRLLVVSDLWNHYAAAVFRSRIRFRTFPLPRGRRYCGQSQMAFSGLVLHGLSAISVFSDIVGARLLLCMALVAVVAAVLLCAVVGLRVLTDWAIPGWATTAAGLLVVVLMQALLFLLVLAFVILGNRSQTRVIPLRDADAFVDRVQELLTLK